MDFNISFIIFTLFAATTLVQGQRQCNLYCDDSERRSSNFPNPSNPPTGSQGLPGKRGPKGESIRGEKGEPGSCECNIGERLEENLEELQQEVRRTYQKKNHLFESCKEILEQGSNQGSGIYYIRDANGIEYPVFCDMSTGGGGWTLVASVHENNLSNNGRCTSGDRWSSTQGSTGRPRGDGNWENLSTFGYLSSITSDDYKNPGYFDINASNVMIWQVANDTPLSSCNSSSYLQYRTTNNFLRNYKGNLYHLFKDYFPIKSGTYNRATDNGPAPAVHFDKGNAAEVLQHQAPNVKPHIDAGFIQFRVLNGEKNAFAMCPGVRAKASHHNAEHSCIGSTDTAHVNYCGDFAAFAWDGIGTHTRWSVDAVLTNTAFLIFYH